MPYDPTRPHSPRQRYEQLQADRRAAEMAKADDERLLEGWAGLSDAEVLRAIRQPNISRRDREVRKRVARLRGVLAPETPTEALAREEREAFEAEYGEPADREELPRVGRRRG